MRAKYPVSSKEIKNELNELQEHMIRILGYDANPHDNYIDRRGQYDDTNESIDASGLSMMQNRLFSEADEPQYTPIYRANLAYHIRRRTNG